MGSSDVNALSKFLLESRHRSLRPQQITITWVCPVDFFFQSGVEKLLAWAAGD